MTTSIDQKVLMMKFDGRNFQQGTARALRDISKLKNELNFDKSIVDMARLDAAANKINFAGMGNALESINSKLSVMGVVAAAAITKMTNSVIDATRKLFSTFVIAPITTGLDEYETKINAIQTILANTESKGTTLVDVSNSLNELNTYADQTIYNFAQMTQNIGRFTTAGVGLKESTSAIKGIANLAAVSGANAQQASMAMYQLSQALSSGRVKLRDWMSVENAGMGGELFRESLLRTARVHGIAVDQMIEANGSFRDSLSEGWLSDTIMLETLQQISGDYSEEQLKMMGYNDQQVKDIMHLGEVAVDAATKVKTWTQLKSTTAEAMQSGWARSWEIIIGDFDEAKEVFSDLSSFLEGIIGQSAQSRNELLSGWKALGGRTILLEALSNTLEAVVNYTSLASEAFHELVPKITAKRLAELSARVLFFTRSFKMGSDTYVSIKKIFRGIGAAVQIVSMVLTGAVKIVAKLTKHFGLSGSNMLTYVARLGDMVVALYDILAASDLLNDALHFIDALFYGVSDAVSYLHTEFKKLTIVQQIGEAFSKLDTSGVGTFLNNITTILLNSTNVGSILKSIFNGLVTFVQHVAPIFWQLAGNAAEGLSKLLNGLYEAIGKVDLKDAIDTFNAGLMTSILFSLKSIIGGENFFSNMLEGIFGTTTAKSTLFEITEEISKMFDGLRLAIKSWQESLKADTMLKIAAALSLITASIYVLSKIDSKALVKAMATITASFAELFGATGSLAMLGASGSASLSTQLVASSLALLIYAGALKKLSGINPKELTSGIAAATAGLTSLVLAMKPLSGTEGAISASIGIIALSLSMVVMAKAILLLGKAKRDELLSGILTMGAILTSIGVFLKLYTGGVSGVAAAISIAALAGSLYIMAFAIERFAKIETRSLIQGLLGITGVLASVAIFTRTVGSMKDVIVSAAKLVVLSGAIYVLSLAMKQLGDLTWAELSRSLAGLAGGLVILIGALALMPKSGMFKAATLLVLVTALEGLSKALAAIGQMSWQELGRGLTGLSVGLLAIVGVLSAMPKSAILKAATLVIISKALGELAVAMSAMGQMSWDEILRSLLVLGGSLTVLAVGLNAMTAALPGAFALGVVSVTLIVLAKALLVLGSIGWNALITSLLGLAGIFAVLAAAGYLLTPVVPSLIGLGAAMLTIGAGAALMGAGLALAAYGLTTLAGSAAVIAAGLTLLGGAILGILPGIIKMVGLVLKGLLDVVLELLPGLWKLVVLLVGGLIDSLKVLVPQIVDTLLFLITEILRVFLTYVPEVIDMLLDLLMEIIDVLTDKTPELLQVGIAWLLAFVEGITDQMPVIADSAFKSIIAFMDALTLAIEENMPEMLASGERLAKAILDGMVQGVISGLPRVAKAASEIGAKALASLKETLGIHSPSKPATDMGANTTQGLILGLQSKGSELYNTMVGLGTTLLDSIRGGIRDTVSVGMEYADSIGTGIRGRVDSIISSSTTVISALVNAFALRVNEFKASGNAMMNALASAILYKKSYLVSSVTTISNTMHQVFSDTYSVYWTVGLNVVRGIADGIADNQYLAVSAATNLGDAVLAAAQAALDIHSPSKVFRWVGKMLSTGLANGITENIGLAAKAMRSVKATLLTGMETVSDDILALLNGNMTLAPVITPVLDDRLVRKGIAEWGTSIDASMTRPIETQAPSPDAAQPGVTDSKSETVVQYNQTINAPTALNAGEIYRRSRNLASTIKRRDNLS